PADRPRLVVQGPPGSGKTRTIGRLIPALVAAGRTVGVASQSHKAIHNVLDAIDAPFAGKKKASGGNPESYYEGEHVENVTDNDDVVDCDVAAGTAWLFSDPEHECTLD